MQPVQLTLGIVSLFVLATVGVQADEPPAVIGPHRAAYEAHRDTPTSPDLLADAGRPVLPLAAGTGGIVGRPCATVFGYLPYWSSSANLRYDLLTHLAAFSVEVRADGTLGNDHGWPWVGVINQAHQAGVKVILVATLFNGSDIQTLITNPTFKNRFFTNIKAKMLEGAADGLNVDFESGTTWQGQINAFMAELTAFLHAELPGSEVTFAGPAVNWSNRWDLAGLAASCDGIFIMGYAFAGSWSSTSAPNAPLTGGSINVTNTVLTQYAAVVQSDPGKLILGVPYYGNEWTTASSNARSPVNSYVGSTRFYNDEPDSQSRGALWETASQTPWYRWQVGSTWHQVWFDDAASLGLKYDLALARGLQGVGTWALGYDGARTELWDVLASRFGGCGICCDIDGDGDADADDVGMLLFCLQGPGTTYSAGHVCLNGDADADTDVDLADFAWFQRSFGN